ncbi:unnamed protein product [Caenorhabditis auriculariae]|uniref:Nuclear transcription factor Y subunit n=1 Tax=Caenorhabditis auriculariae TaxID=2777116 RepID=A0A8S1HYJ9_9PELO|nr:unnamed protein product [Caenorhabditis auriculariae]
MNVICIFRRKSRQKFIEGKKNLCLIPLQIIPLGYSLGSINFQKAEMSSRMLKNFNRLVNPKQFERILKRRAYRLKLVSEGRIHTEKQKFMHLSRHLHAKGRTRSKMGTFEKCPRTEKENTEEKNLKNMTFDEFSSIFYPSTDKEPSKLDSMEKILLD